MLLLSPPPLAQRGLPCPQSEVQSAVRASCTTHTPLHGASSLHNPRGQGQGAQLWLMGPIVCIQASKLISTVGWPHEKRRLGDVSAVLESCLEAQLVSMGQKRAKNPLKHLQCRLL